MSIFEDIRTFKNYDKQHKEEYLKKIFELQDDFLIGRVKSYLGKTKFFQIENLRNPYNGKRVGDYLIGAKPINHAKSKENFLEEFENSEVLFQFEVLEGNLDEGRIKNGLILRVKKDSVSPINDYSDVFRELNIDISDLSFPVGVKKTGHQDYFVYPFTSFYNDIILRKSEELIKQLKEKQKEREEELEGKLNKRKIEIDLNLSRRESKIKLDRTKLDKDMARHNEKVEMLRRDQNQFETRLSTIKETNKKLSQLGFFSDLDELSQKNFYNKIILEVPKTETELLTTIQNQIFTRKKRLVYEKDTLRKFYSALKTNELIILSGPSGTGKSSLVSALADTIGARKRIIPVQPSWIDKQDLLGFYNPISKQYTSSPLLDVIIEAKENKEKYKENADLFLVCLDELNLAQIEYYLADILSVREQEDEGIQLYSLYEYEQAMEEIKWYVQKTLNTNFDEWKQQEGIDSLKELEFRQRYKNLTRFEPIVHIPDNLRFIGTINIDGTTKGLSPKVIDRSFIIPLEKQEKEEQKIQVDIGVIPLTAEFFTVNDTVKGQLSLQAIENTLNSSKFRESIAKLNADYNHRVIDHIKKYIMINGEMKVGQETLLDEVILMKILPRINYLLEGEDDHHGEEFRGIILKLLKEESASFKKLNRMVNNSSETNVITYWG